ncbi:unnamed protein product [Allacma fusca]|uniref:Uncharacterized protein n=1 Tax=Allacma fusca TaxID=39272 RepID=A0A8J2KSV7_9HEXA|nr:unnamed protein product [Allacma fusca]
MKSISIAFILITWTAVQSESPPRANYYHSSYDDLAYQEELPSLYPTQESHAHAHEHAHGHSHAHSHAHAPAHAPAHAHAQAHHAHAPAHGHGHGPVQHEVVVQHHHYSPQGHSTRVVSHGTPEGHYPSPSHKTRGHHHSHSHAYPVKSAYHAPKTEAVETPGLYAGYSSVKANDYKAYSMHTPASHSDDYGIEAYTPAHTADYGTPGSYHNLPAYKGSALSYAPPGDGSAGGAYALTQSPALGSYSVDHLESQYQRPKAKGHRAPSHSHSSHSHSAYASAVKTPSYSKGLTTYGAPKTVAYSSPNAYASPNAYTSPKYTTIYANKPAYASTKPASYTVGSSIEKVKNYFRQPSKTYGTAAQYGNYASAAPSYAYGSPATKGMAYTYSQYEKPSDKGYVRFADESYGAVPPASLFSEDGSSALVAQGADETENYGGGYDAGTAHY